MARPKMPNLLYFPKDVNFFRDRKIRNLLGRYGGDGVCAYEYLLCEIYGDKGYYVVWDEDLEDAIISDLNLSENFTKQLLNYLLKRSLFDDKLFKSVEVLTAKSIQRRYQSAKSASSSKVEVQSEYWLLSEEETLSCIKVMQNKGFSEENHSKSEENHSKSEDNALKESKEKESKGKESKRFVKPTADEIRAYCEQSGYSIDVLRFLDYYEANGWMAGRNPMKDWKAAVRNWARRDKDFGSPNQKKKLNFSPSFDLEKIKEDARNNTDIKF